MSFSRLAFAFGLACTSACSSSNFELAESDAAAPTDSVADTSASPDTFATEDTVATDTEPGDTNPRFLDAPIEAGGCSPDEKPLASGFFASPSGNDAMGDGSALKPFRSVGLALEKARTLGRSRVYLDVGTYAESVRVQDSTTGVIVEGGWKLAGGVWGRNCAGDARAQTVISSPTNTGVLVEGSTKISGLRTVTVKTKPKGATAPDKAGESMFGVLILGAGVKFTLEDVDVIAGDAGNGGAAKSGSPTMGLACTSPCATGGPGVGGVSGAKAKVPGSFGTSGFTPTDGSPGLPGGSGEMGTPGGAGLSGTCVGACTGMAGTPGGFCGNLNATKVSAAGSCGCGGAGGEPGAAGRGGGAAIAVLVAGDAAGVQILNASLKAGNGGNGSLGGNGADGTVGGAGKPGMALECSPGCYRQTSSPYDCALGTGTLAGGAAGGYGGKGGRGGDGGAGAGGPSYGLVTIGTGAMVSTKATTFAHGTGGDGAIVGTSGNRFP